MFSVALIGPDGAGKTTIARMLEKQSPLPLKYIYMGVNIEASNFALPTSRVFEYLKRLQTGNREISQAERPAAQPLMNGKQSFGRTLWAAGRLANYLTDEWYRQLWSWAYQCGGYIALYDRHYLFDFSIDDGEQHGIDTHLHRWFLAHLYPRPNLVIYLDAPAEVLFARKGEKDIEDLNRRRQSFLQQMSRNPNCVVVDGTQPLSKVYADVAAHIFQSYKMPSRKSAPVKKEPSEAPTPSPADPDRLSESAQ